VTTAKISYRLLFFQVLKFSGFLLNSHAALETEPHLGPAEVCFLKVGLGFVRMTCEFAGMIQCTKHFIEFVYVETDLLFGINSNVILTRQTYGHRLSRVDWSKCRALAFYFFVRICYVLENEFVICFENRNQTHFEIGSWHCAAAFSLQVPKSCTHVDLTFLYILISRTYTKFIQRNKMLALGICFPQPCSLFVCLFACLFVWIQPEKLYFAFCVGREVHPLGVITHGQRH